MSWEKILKEKFEGPTPKSPKGSVDEIKNAGRLLQQVNSGLETIKNVKGNLDVIYNLLEIEGIDELINENRISGFTRPEHFIKSIESKINLLETNLEDLLEYFKGIHQYGAHAQERMDEHEETGSSTQYWGTGKTHPMKRKTKGFRDEESVWDDSSKLEERYRQKKR